MVLDPAATPVATPAALMVATPVLEDVQVTVAVMLLVLPSLYVPVAVNCCVAPAAMLGDAGVTAMELSVGAFADTVSVAEPETLLYVAVMLVDPAATALAIPPLLMVAIPVLLAVHVADDVTSVVEPSL